MNISIHLTLGFLAVSICLPSASRAYDEYSHEWITRSAFTYLRTNPHFYPETKLWLDDLGGDADYLEEVLVRGVVDTDYRSDLWLDAWFHGLIEGSDSDNFVADFTTMFHFLTVITPGEYWDYDGYSYRDGTKKGNDKYLGLPIIKVLGANSFALGGSPVSGHEIHGAVLGPYSAEFKGTEKDWKKLYFGDNLASHAVMPPSYVPAEIAYQKMLGSSRSPADTRESWTEASPLVKTIFGNAHLTRQYWRGEVATLPEYVDLLALVMHLNQDATVPHHVEDTSDRCHVEYEKAVDQLACGTTGKLDYTNYYNGTFGSGGAYCGELYDPSLVTQIISELSLMDASDLLSVKDRMIRIALQTARWDWRVSSKKAYATLLPNGDLFTSKTCQAILSQQEVQEQAKYQFNLAIAATVALFETAAHEYETLHAEDAAPINLTPPWATFE
jgi:hypothetical protein